MDWAIIASQRETEQGNEVPDFFWFKGGLFLAVDLTFLTKKFENAAIVG